jgi:hypothetical protein
MVRNNTSESKEGGTCWLVEQCIGKCAKPECSVSSQIIGILTWYNHLWKVVLQVFTDVQRLWPMATWWDSSHRTPASSL